MIRRDLVVLLAGAVAWPAFWHRAGRAQEPAKQVRRIGILMTADNAESQARISAFQRALQELGWTDGRNVKVEIRWGGGYGEHIRRVAAELVATRPDAILAMGSAPTGPLLPVTRSVPIVFVYVPDPVGAGFVDNLARPGSHATGFT